MTDINTVQQTLEAALTTARDGIADCQARLAEIDAIRQKLIDYQHQVFKIEAALEVLNRDDPPRNRTAAVPTTKPAFWLELLGDRKLSTADLYALGCDKLGLEPNSEEAKLLRQRLGNTISHLVKAHKLVPEGAKGSQVYSKASAPSAATQPA